MNIEKQKEKFKNHVATYTDYGNIKILDFKNPNSSEYRIRFLFEEDYYRLHISGDLGELIATNYENMTYDKFYQFVDNIDYFKEKINCHSRHIYTYEEEKAREELLSILEDGDLIKDNILSSIRYNYYESDEEKISEFLEDALEDFSSVNGISAKAFEIISDYIEDFYEEVSRIGRKNTGILELYMLAFKLAKKQLKEQK